MLIFFLFFYLLKLRPMAASSGEALCVGLGVRPPIPSTPALTWLTFACKRLGRHDSSAFFWWDPRNPFFRVGLNPRWCWRRSQRQGAPLHAAFACPDAVVLLEWVCKGSPHAGARELAPPIPIHSTTPKHSILVNSSQQAGMEMKE